MNRPLFGAVLLAAGKGSRMNSETPKQYLNVNGNPILYYSLMVLEQSPIDQIVLVVRQGEREKVRAGMIEKYGMRKVTEMVDGGEERSHSVYNGLRALTNVDYVLIHDGARPCIDVPMIKRVMEEVVVSKACVVGMPVKDTIKIVNEKREIVDTPDRSRVWMVQTPQAFDYHLIRNAYDEYMMEEKHPVTDDAMVLELVTRHKVKIIEGGYQNIKVTTPEDLKTIEGYL